MAVPAAATQSPVIDTHMSAKYPFHPPEPNYRKPKEDGSVELYLDGEPAPDGQLFLMRVDRGEPRPISVVLNWQAR